MENVVYQVAKDVVSYNDETDRILTCISDKYCRYILSHTRDKPKSAFTIALETKIPISTVYRRIQELIKLKLLHVSGEITLDGKKIFYYHNTIQQIDCFFSDNETSVKIFYQK